MEARDLVNGWIIQYGNRTGKYFRLGQDGVFAVKDDQDQEYVVDIPENSEKIYFCAPIVTLNDETTKSEDMQCMLKWNLWGEKTQGGTLSFEESTNRIVFHKIFSIQQLDEQAFTEEFNRFIQSVDYIQELWKNYQQNKSRKSFDTNEMPMFRI